ncbi:MAG: hypothetical protein LBN30_05390 [Oscillospiraceae bacterium]|jgi:hypothetical protein|nr:hypothetical protein [Oscillospiraceae bacterium]
MNAINEKISHRQFGDGVITEQVEAMITVQFDAHTEVKKFVYPAAFSTFLKFCDSSVQEKFDAEMRLVRERLDEEQKVRDVENEKHREELRVLLLEQKRAAAKRAAAARKPAAKAKKVAAAPTEE